MLVRRTTPESRDEGASHKIDYVGLGVIAVGLVALLYALNEGPTLGWGSMLVLGSVVAAVVLLTAFVLIERRVKEPLIDLGLFKRRSYDGALIDNLIYNITLSGTMYVLALYLEEVCGYDALTAGLLLLPSTVGILAFIMVGARLELRRGPRIPLTAGFFIMGVGTFLVGFLTPETAYWWFATGLFIQGVGIGLYSTPLSDVAVGLAPPDESGAASGAFKMCSMVGGAFGVAVFGGVYRAIQTVHAQGERGGGRPDQRAAEAGQRRLQQFGEGQADLRLALQGRAGQGPRRGAPRALDGIGGSLKLAAGLRRGGRGRHAAARPQGDPAQGPAGRRGELTAGPAAPPARARYPRPTALSYTVRPLAGCARRGAERCPSWLKERDWKSRGRG